VEVQGPIPRVFGMDEKNKSELSQELELEEEEKWRTRQSFCGKWIIGLIKNHITRNVSARSKRIQTKIPF
jgi:hypothetical protein